MLTVRANDILVLPVLDLIIVVSKLTIKQHQICICMAFPLSPKKYLSG